jgi:hypothetical protein
MKSTSCTVQFICYFGASTNKNYRYKLGKIKEVEFWAIREDIVELVE